MEEETTHVNKHVLAPEKPLLEERSSLASAEENARTNDTKAKRTRCRSTLTQPWRGILVLVAPLLLLPLPLLTNSKETRCGYVILIMATLWMTEALPIAVTALIPVFAFPVLGILGTDDVCLLYMKENVMMSFGGLMAATAVEQCNLHRRVAFFVLLHVGQSPRWLLAGFMMTTMFLSMWISNTATTTMMTPIVAAVLLELNKGYNTRDTTDLEIARNRHPEVDQNVKDQVLTPLQKNKTDSVDRDLDISQDVEATESATVDEYLNDDCRRLRDMCFLGTAYAANLGGTGTLTGTGPNIVLKGILQSYTEPTGLNYSTWMAFNIPGMLLCVTLAWMWLQFLYIGFGKTGKVRETSAKRKEAIKGLLRRKYEDLGSLSFHECVVMFLFITLVLLWLSRSPSLLPGWGKLLEGVYGHSVEVDDASSVMLIVFLLFAIPSKPNFWCFRPDENVLKPSPGCLTWQMVHEKVPWKLLFLFGGGFAMAEGARKSGLSTWLGHQLVYLDALPKEVIVLVVCIAIAMVTEVTSNTATSAVVLPILKELAIGIDVSPLYLMLPATVCCSYAFMLPIATAPNAIVYAASNMRNTEMMRAGIVMNLICVLVITVMINTLGVAMFDVKNLPAWANSTDIVST
ncbi:Na(+)/citrate cotransporter-like isoform X2 [Oratosquilla oratoria]|uniref:Na(+)/citrate cotransporter-like isoform X2 n=1 Tax=Oratosquilla oratoria TaxID=337810 RepID=UPI003F75E7F1